jgi:hypothetical protein
VKLSEQTISALSSIITGDGRCSPYRTGPQLVSFFNQFGSEDTYGNGFPSRWYYAEEKLRDLNNTAKMKEVLIAVLDPRSFLAKEFDINVAVEHLNQFLDFDDYELRLSGKKWNVYRLSSSSVELLHPYENSVELTHISLKNK